MVYSSINNDNKKIWVYEGEFSKSFKETDCKDSTILITNEKNENFLEKLIYNKSRKVQ